MKLPVQDHTRLGCRRYSSQQVQQLFSVSAGTVARWAEEGKLPYIRTMGRHRRYDADVVDALLAELEDS